MTDAAKTILQQDPSADVPGDRPARFDRARSAWRWTVSGAWLLLVFTFGCLSIEAVYLYVGPPRYVPALTPKLRHLAQNPGKYDLLLFGSSRVFRGFMTQEFDRLMGEAGIPMRSFNVGIDGMSPPESFYTVRLALAQGERPKWMLIELWDLRTVSEIRFADIVRYVHWHNLRNTALVVERVWRDAKLPVAEKLRRTGVQLYTALVRHAQRGQAATWLQPMLDRPRPGKAFVEPTPWLATQGFSPDNSKPFEGAKRAAYEDALKAVRSADREIPLPPTIRRAAADLVREVRAAGVEPVFLIPPTVNGAERFAPLRPQGVDAELITFADAVRFADLYRTDWHRDDMHMTEVGARALTAHFAEEFRRIFGPSLHPSARP